MKKNSKKIKILKEKENINCELRRSQNVKHYFYHKVSFRKKTLQQQNFEYLCSLRIKKSIIFFIYEDKQKYQSYKEKRKLFILNLFDMRSQRGEHIRKQTLLLILNKRKYLI
jgi:hypothetical protein